MDCVYITNFCTIPVHMPLEVVERGVFSKCELYIR